MRYERERSIVADARMLCEYPERLGELACETDIDYENDNPELRALRREFYTLLSVGISSAVDTFVAKSQTIEPLGLIRTPTLGDAIMTNSDFAVKAQDITSAPSPYLELSSNMRSTIDGLLMFRELKYPEADPNMTAILERIDEIGPNLTQSVPPRNAKYPVKNFAETQMRVGLATFADKAPQFMRAIELGAIKQHGSDVTQQDISSMAQVSNLHQRIAAMGIEEFMLWTIRFPGTGNFDFSFDDYFVLSAGVDGKTRVDFARELPPDPEGILESNELTERFSHKIGCPALIRLVDDSALQKMWSWSTNIAEQTVWQRA